MKGSARGRAQATVLGFLLSIALCSCSNPVLPVSPPAQLTASPFADFAFLPLPALPTWSASVGTIDRVSADELHHRGDASGWSYQVVSAPFAVEPDRDILLRLRVKVESGRVAVGILSGDQSYFLPQTHWRVSSDEVQDYLFNSGANSKLYVVVVNDNDASKPHESTLMTIFPGNYAYVPAH